VTPVPPETGSRAARGQPADGRPSGTALAEPAPTEVLASCQVSDLGAVYVVGCLERRVTLYAQQVRALNLVDALIASGKLTAASRVAIVGAGAAGLTAAAAIVRALPGIRTLELFERKPELLHLQTASRDRYLHPHLYDWPVPGTRETRAGLPLLDWTAGPASDVADHLVTEFARLTESSPVRIRASQAVEQVDELPLGLGCRLRIEGHTPRPEYDLCLLTIGFGLEHFAGSGANTSYWDASR